MARTYIAGASHTAAGVITEVSTLTGLATMLQVATPATTGIIVRGWGISFDGITATDAPGICYLMDSDVGMSAATSLTPDAFDAPATDVVSLCVGGTGSTCVSDGAVTEGTITASRLLDAQEVHPQTGYSVWFPADSRPYVTISRFLRLRVNFAVAVNCLPWICWSE